MTSQWFNAITDVPFVRVGHATDPIGMTGCTVILCEGDGAVGGVDVRGAAPGTRETDLLRPGHLVERVNGILLTGGSAFGLAAADGVMTYLEEQRQGFNVMVTVVPIVPAAVVFDLLVGDPKARPTPAMGYQACQAAQRGPVAEGSVGVGIGCTVGKILGPFNAMRGGVGTASLQLPQGLVVGALMAVNAFGDVIDPQTGQIVAGARTETGAFLDTAAYLRAKGMDALRPFAPTNTVIGVVATNARLTKDQSNRVAAMAHDGLARAIRPAHTMVDGDTIFCLAAGEVMADVTLVGHAAAEVVAAAILRGVRTAQQ
jgi:L-aminopeptidase/D-esterase-like protein